MQARDESIGPADVNIGIDEADVGIAKRYGIEASEVIIDPANVRIGERYTFYGINGDDNIIRGTVSHISKNNHVSLTNVTINGITKADRYIFSFPLDFARRITQYNIGPNKDTAGEINSFLGGKRKSRRRRTKRKGTQKKGTKKKGTKKKGTKKRKHYMKKHK